MTETGAPTPWWDGARMSAPARPALVEGPPPGTGALSLGLSPAQSDSEVSTRSITAVLSSPVCGTVGSVRPSRSPVT